MLNASKVGDLDGGDAVAATDGGGKNVVMDVVVGDSVTRPEIEAAGIGDGYRGDAAGVAVAAHDGNIKNAGAATGVGGDGIYMVGAVVGGVGDDAGSDNGVNPGR